MRAGHGDLIAAIVNLGEDFDRTILRNGAPLDRVARDGYSPDKARAYPQPEIHLNPNKLAKYDIVTKVLADSQRIG